MINKYKNIKYLPIIIIKNQTPNLVIEPNYEVEDRT